MEDFDPHLKICIDDLDRCLDDAAAYKHRDYGGSDISYCQCSLKSLLQRYEEVVAGDRRIPPYVEAKVKHLKAETRTCVNELYCRALGDYIFGCLVPRFNIEIGEEEMMDLYSDATIFQFERYGIKDAPLSIGKWSIHYDMIVLRWMSLQVELLKVDDGAFNMDYDDHKPRNFLDPSSLTSHFDELVENKMKLRDPAQEVDAITQDQLILDLMLKIAEAGKRRSLWFACNEFELSCFSEAIKEASECFDDLFSKLPANCDMTLKQWFELKILPKIQQRSMSAKRKRIRMGKIIMKDESNYASKKI